LSSSRFAFLLSFSLGMKRPISTTSFRRKKYTGRIEKTQQNKKKEYGIHTQSDTTIQVASSGACGSAGFWKRAPADGGYGGKSMLYSKQACRMKNDYSSGLCGFSAALTVPLRVLRRVQIFLSAACQMQSSDSCANN